MSAAAAGTPRGALVALAVTLALQMFTALAVSATAVLAPEIARDLAVSPKLIGVFVGFVYAGAALASLACGGFIARYGAIRVSQSGVALCALGLALLPLTAGSGGGAPAFYAVAALLLGFGYGPITPASSQVLIRTAPPERLALTFSIKQTGVPAGFGIAGALLPGFALAFGWRGALYAVAAAGALIAVLAQPTRASLDSDRHANAPISVAGVFAPLRLVFAERALAQLALTGFAYAATQVCLLSFLVVYLTEELGHSLIAAGLALTAANAGGIVGRILWGAVADRYVRPRTLLGLIGIGTGVCSGIVAAFAAGWPPAALLAVCTLYGATAIGWNGVQLSQVARLAPPGKAGIVTGAAGFVTFGGVVVGPPAFALLAGLAGSYRAGFVAFGMVALACAVWVLRSRRWHV